jgi:uncharacterized protein with HEPN domain
MPRERGRPKPDDAARLRHILDAAKEAIEFVDGRSLDEFSQDRMAVRAVVNCLQVIGEAAAHLDESSRAAIPAAPWPKVVGLRHILVHEYYDVDESIIHRTVVTNLPELVAVISSYFKE